MQTTAAITLLLMLHRKYLLLSVRCVYGCFPRLMLQCVKFGLIYDFYIHRLHILPINTVINVYNHSTIKVIWFSNP